MVWNKLMLATMSAVCLAGCWPPDPSLIVLTGRVVDVQTEAPIEGATVILLRRDDQTEELEEGPRSRTEVHGQFRLEYHIAMPLERPWQNVRLRILGEGYKAFVDDKPRSVLSPGTKIGEDGVKIFLLQPE